jgi:outer membrane receptor protein involved in Fe transport
MVRLWILALPLPGLAQDFAATPVLQGLSLEDAIAALEDAGLTVFYSSDLVKPAMQVGRQPSGQDLRELLRSILAPFELTIRTGPGDSVMIVSGATGGALGVEKLEPDGASLEPVIPQPAIEEIIVAASQYEFVRAIDAAAVRLTNSDIEYLPDLGDDALRAVHRLPGTATNGLSARANVRGGEAGETLVRFDALRLYDPFHLENFQSIFSTVDPRVVSTMDVYTGGFSAIFGDRMSSVVDVASLAAPAPRYHELAVSFFNSSALTAGTFDDDKGEWLGSIRRSNLDLLYNAFSPQPERPRYIDGFARLSHQLNSALRVSFNTLYFEDDIVLSDDLDSEERASSSDQDRYVWLRFDHTPASALTGVTLLSRTSLSGDRSGVSNKEGISAGVLEDRRSFTIHSLQSEWSLRVSEMLLLQFGGSVGRSRGTYDYRDEVQFDLLFDTAGAPGALSRARAAHVAPRGDQYSLYGSLRYRPTQRLTADFGIRWDKQTLDPSRSDSIGPRLGLRYRLAPGTYLRASWGRFHQAQSINELQVTDGIEHFYAPQRSDHAVMGLEHDFPNGINLRIEAYDKEMRRLRPRYESLLNPLTLLPELAPDRIAIAPSAASARGVELAISGSLDNPFRWWAGYTWSRATDSVAGADVLRSWDQTHAVSGGMNWKTAKWDVGFALAYRSGWPTTPVRFDPGDAIPLVVSGPRNSARVDFYRSVDLRLTRTFDIQRGRLSAFLELNNAFGRSNQCCFEYQVELDDAGDPLLELSHLHYLPLIPSIGFVWSF